QPQQPLPVAAEGVEANGDGPAVGPQDLIAFVLDVFALPVPGRVSPEKDGQGAWHPCPFPQVGWPSCLSGGCLERRLSWRLRSITVRNRVPLAGEAGCKDSLC